MEKLKETLVNILSSDPCEEEFNKAVSEIGVNEHTVEYATKKFFNMNELVQLFEKAGTVRALAQTIEKHTLRDIAENVMQFVHFMAKHVHKQSFRYFLGLDDIFDTLYTHLHIRGVGLQEGEKDQGIYQECRFIATLDWYTQIAKDAQKGDSEALEYLPLSKVPDLPINKLNHCPNYLSLSATYSAMIEVGMIATFMEDRLALIQLMQRTFNKKDVYDLVDAMDVLQTAATKKKRKGLEPRTRSKEMPPDIVYPPPRTSLRASLVAKPPQKKKDKNDTRKKRSHHKTRKSVTKP